MNSLINNHTVSEPVVNAAKKIYKLLKEWNHPYDTGHILNAAEYLWETKKISGKSYCEIAHSLLTNNGGHNNEI